jgi:hypothetical protein
VIWAVNNIVFPQFDSKITINTYKIRFGQKLRMHPLKQLFQIAIADYVVVTVCYIFTILVAQQ